MDRHHLLALLDRLQDGEFAEAIGGKKKPIEFKENDLVMTTSKRERNFPITALNKLR